MADTVALGFICKNESHVIERMIRSCGKYVQEVFALDTGSTDNTVEIIEKVCAELGLPATIAQVEWTNFGEMRSVLLDEARKNSQADWLFIMDADWTLEVGEGVKNPFEDLGKDSNARAYTMTIHDSGQEWPLPNITYIQHPWRYEGPVHEFLTDDGAGIPLGATKPHLSGSKCVHHNDGGNRVGRHARDAEMLKGKGDPRSQFYYAQSLFAIGQFEKALDAYLRRSENLNGWEEERYFALYKASQCAKRLGQLDRAVGLGLRAWGLRQTRLEALCGVLEILRETQQWALAYMFGGTAVSIARDGKGLKDQLFVEKWRWEWGAMWEYLASCAVVASKNKARLGWEAMLERDDLPEGYRAATEYNLNWLKSQEEEQLNLTTGDLVASGTVYGTMKETE